MKVNSQRRLHFTLENEVEYSTTDNIDQTLSLLKKGQEVIPIQINNADYLGTVYIYTDRIISVADGFNKGIKMENDTFVALVTFDGLTGRKIYLRHYDEMFNEVSCTPYSDLAIVNVKYEQVNLALKLKNLGHGEFLTEEWREKNEN
ncbi:gp39 [Listeria phage P40]|uniref:gp39 n=1 Tax=Listeria phage P40 TaxID=560178 RepID=UPI00018198F4|nr:gp39 [Listeria phage P40]ACI00399.1 gp39 [Listeria phage P40]